MGEIYYKIQLCCNDDYTDCLMLYLMLPLNKDLSHKIIYSHKMTQPVTLVFPEEIVKFSYYSKYSQDWMTKMIRSLHLKGQDEFLKGFKLTEEQSHLEF